tara:strand:- start:206 stop:1057 length:852 start_codon:yes stop_codon:yes gene_type:complete
LEDTKGNSEDFFDKVAEEVVSDSDNFFQDLENDVNPEIYDNNPPKEQATPEAKVHPDSDGESGIDWEDDDNPYKKRYSDSSREAQNQKAQAEENKPYNALINVMKKDPALIDTVQEYLENGKKSSLPEDFIFDADEAMSDRNSDSARVFQNAVENIVNQKIGQSESKMDTRMTREEEQRQTRANARKWMSDKGMTEEEFASMMDKADNHTISYDDIYTILNQDKIKKNVSKDTKKDVMQQMKSVREAPTTASGTGSADTKSITDDDRVFEVIRGADNDNLFDS